MSSSLKVGDVVRRVDGGLWMTVEGFDDEAGNVVRCKWFEGKDRHEQPFPKEQIEVHPNTERPPSILTDVSDTD